jgi:hypothetical protein
VHRFRLRRHLSGDFRRSARFFYFYFYYDVVAKQKLTANNTAASLFSATNVFLSLSQHSDFITQSNHAIQGSKLASTEAQLDHLTATNTASLITSCVNSREIPPSYCIFLASDEISDLLATNPKPFWLPTPPL